MKYWKNEYSIAKENIQELKPLEGVIVGFNVNIDKIIDINPDLLSRVLNNIESVEQITSKPIPSMILNINDLFCSLIDAIRCGKADESPILSEDLGVWIEENFIVKNVQIGGQAGIMSNLLRRMKIDQVLLSLPSFNSELIDLLDSSIFSVTNKNETMRIGSIKDTKREEENIYHYIFEFKKGDYLVGEETIKCSRSNRFIASLDTVNSSIQIKENFRRYSTENINDFSSAIISGFHLMNPKITQKTHLEVLKPVKSLLTDWKKLNPNLTLHLEMAAIKDKQLSELIIEINKNY
jgi:ADP-dependent phosphofructokinase/glucokinase